MRKFLQLLINILVQRIDLLLLMFEGVDNEEYKTFTATLHKMMGNIRKHGI